MAPDPSDKDNPSFIQSATPRTVLFANSSISGKLSYNLPVKIDGNFTGEIKSTELLVIGANAQRRRAYFGPPGAVRRKTGGFRSSDGLFGDFNRGLFPRRSPSRRAQDSPWSGI